MPLFTYVMSYRGTTRVAQLRRSNPTGFLMSAVGEAFPDLRPWFGDLMRMRPEPLPGAQRIWRCSLRLRDGDFTLHVVETRD